MAAVKIDKKFAENLGTSLGWCAGEQSTRLFSREFATAAGVSLSPIPFVGSAKKRRFKAEWAVFLHGCGLLAALTHVPELGNDERLVRRVVTSMQSTIAQMIEAPLLRKMTEEERRRIEQLRALFLRTGRSSGTTLETMARTFIGSLSDVKPDAVPAERAAALVESLKKEEQLFLKLIRISLGESEKKA